MHVEPYRTPYNSKGEVAASKWISYVLRKEETGLLCATAIMNNPKVAEALKELREKQTQEFKKNVSEKSLEFWRNRDILEKYAHPSEKVMETAEWKIAVALSILQAGNVEAVAAEKELKPLSRQKMQRSRILAQEKIVKDNGPVGEIMDVGAHRQVHQLVHDMMMSEKFHLTVGESEGKMFQMPLDKSLLNDPDGEEKMIAAVQAVRDCFPSNMPVVLSVHFDKEENNPHIHGWIYDRVWDVECNEWGKIHPLTTTREGLSKLRRDVDAAILRTTGTMFGDQRKKLDPERPVQTQFTKRQAFWVQHFRGRQDEMLTGAFLEKIRNPYEREAMRQFVEVRKYDLGKLRAENRQKQKNREWAAKAKELRNPKLTAECSASFDSVEEAYDFQASVKRTAKAAEATKKMKDGSGKNAYTPNSDFYKTKRYHARLTESQTERYAELDDAQKWAEFRDLRKSIERIDAKLNGSLSVDERKNLEFTRDAELKHLRHLKSLLPKSDKTAKAGTKL